MPADSGAISVPLVGRERQVNVNLICIPANLKTAVEPDIWPRSQMWFRARHADAE